MKEELLFWPDIRLKTKCSPLSEIEGKEVDFSKRMLHTMKTSGGIGLAANQVGHLSRVIVMNLDGNRSSDVVMFNPEIVEFSKEKVTFTEGCLSFPGQRIEVERSKYIKLKYIDVNANVQVRDLEDLGSICVQHEQDHLDGIGFFKRLPFFMQEKVEKKYLKYLKKMQREN